ncbi:hypothetical protein BKA81DRAFT_382271 [Phyllosticta paracitricarpa]
MSSNTTDKTNTTTSTNNINTEPNPLSYNPDILDRSQLSRAKQLPTHNVFRLPKHNDADRNTGTGVDRGSGSGSSAQLPTHNMHRVLVDKEEGEEKKEHGTGA